MENDQQITQITSPYAPGYRFMPTDEELVAEYLVKKVNNDPIPIADICEVNLYEHSPSYLAANFPRLGDNEHYFFTPRDRKYPNGNRPNRAVGNEGYWKATGADKAVRTKTGKVIGGKKVLVFYVGKPRPEIAIKTDWIMHEFRLNGPSKRPNSKDMRLDDWVLCRIYKKSESKKQKERKEGVKENVEEIVALDNNNNNNNNNNHIENAIDQQNQDGGGATMMIEGGQNGYLQSQPSYYQEGYTQSIPNSDYDQLRLLAGTSGDNHGIGFGGDQTLNFDHCGELIYHPQYQELAWVDFDHGILGNQGINNDAINFQQQSPCAPNIDVGLKKFADEFVRDEKAGFSNDAAERKK